MAQKVFITRLRLAAGRGFRLNLLKEIAVEEKPRMDAAFRQFVFAFQQTAHPLPPQPFLQGFRLVVPYDAQ